MLWDEKVEEWRKNPVTIAFFNEVERDMVELHTALLDTDDFNQILRLQGMIRAYQAITEIPEDGIPNAEEEEDARQ